MYHYLHHNTSKLTGLDLCIKVLFSSIQVSFRRYQALGYLTQSIPHPQQQLMNFPIDSMVVIADASNVRGAQSGLGYPMMSA